MVLEVYPKLGGDISKKHVGIEQEKSKVKMLYGTVNISG